MIRRHATPFVLPAITASTIALAGALPSVAWAQADAPPAAPTAPAAPADPSAPKAPPTVLPTIASLLEREVASRGGREAVEAVRQMTSKGAITFTAQGVTAPMVVQIAEPASGPEQKGLVSKGKVLTVLTFENGTEIRNGFNGEIGWAMDPALGPRILEGAELEQIRLTASVAGQSAIVSQYAKAEVVGETTWSDKPAYEVKLSGAATTAATRPAEGTPPAAAREATIYFEVATGRIIGMKSTLASARGEVPVVANFLEFKEFAGPKGNITLPVRTEMSAMGMVNVITRSEVSFGEIDPTVFELPPAIKALVAKPATPAPPATSPTPQDVGKPKP